MTDIVALYTEAASARRQFQPFLETVRKQCAAQNLGDVRVSDMPLKSMYRTVERMAFGGGVKLEDGKKRKTRRKKRKRAAQRSRRRGMRSAAEVIEDVDMAEWSCAHVCDVVRGRCEAARMSDLLGVLKVRRCSRCPAV